MKITNNFTVEEYVHQDIISALGKTRAANLVDIYLAKQVQNLRNKFGAITINGTFGGKEFKDSGLRKSSFYKNKLGMIRQSYSTHQWGNTADLKFHDTTPEEVYDYILAHQDEFPFIVRMENAHKTVTWLHIECGRFRDDEIQVFDP